METPFIGQIAYVGYNFAPVNWHFCDGSLLSISEYQALYSLVGTTYGGDGINTFGLPDLRGRVPVGVGQGQGLSPYVLGQVGGVESVTLTVSNYPNHNHVMAATQSAGNTVDPTGAMLASGQQIYTDAAPAETLNSAVCTSAPGNGQAHENRQPFLACNWIIALYGVYPSQG